MMKKYLYLALWSSLPIGLCWADAGAAREADSIPDIVTEGPNENLSDDPRKNFFRMEGDDNARGIFDQSIKPFYDKSTRKSGYKKNGKMIIPAQYICAMYFNKYGVAYVFQADHHPYGRFINTQGHTIAEPFQRDGPDDFNKYGLTRIVKNKKIGLMDIQGSVILEPVYDYIDGFFMNGVAPVSFGCKKDMTEKRYDKRIGGKWGLIDITGRLVLPIMFAGYIHENKHLIFYKNKKAYILCKNKNNHYYVRRYKVYDLPRPSRSSFRKAMIQAVSGREEILAPE